jgi:hypothetical protein
MKSGGGLGQSMVFAALNIADEGEDDSQRKQLEKPR